MLKASLQLTTDVSPSPELWQSNHIQATLKREVTIWKVWTKSKKSSFHSEFFCSNISLFQSLLLGFCLGVLWHLHQSEPFPPPLPFMCFDFSTFIQAFVRLSSPRNALRLSVPSVPVFLVHLQVCSLLVGSVFFDRCSASVWYFGGHLCCCLLSSEWV